MIEVDYNDYKSVVESNMKLIPKNYELTKKVEELQDRINKAIEYIESYLPNYDFDKSNLKELLEILRGDKEWVKN